MVKRYLQLWVAKICTCTCVYASESRILIELEVGADKRVPLTAAQAGPDLAWTLPDGWPNSELQRVLAFEGAEPVTEEWTPYEISFTPGGDRHDDSGGREISLYLRGAFSPDDSRTSWVAYRDIKAEGSELRNGDFAHRKNGVPEGWLIHPGLVNTSAEPPFIYGSYGAFGVKTLKVTNGVPVTISFMARKGGETDYGVMPVKVTKHPSLKLEIGDLKLMSCEEGTIDSANNTISCIPARSGGVLIPVNRDLDPYSQAKVIITTLSAGFGPSDFSGAIFQEAYSPCRPLKCSPVEIGKPVEVLLDLSRAKRDAAEGFRFYFSGEGDMTEPVTFRLDEIEFIDGENDEPSNYWKYTDIIKLPLLKDKGTDRWTAMNHALHRYEPADPERSLPEPVFHAHPASAGTGNISRQLVPVELLEEYGVDRTAAVRFGFPLPEGGLFDIKKIQVRNPAGEAIPFQAAATAFWPDKSLKWVLLQFDAPLKAEEKVDYQVEFGTEVEPESQQKPGFFARFFGGKAKAAAETLTLRDDGEAIVIDTGVLRATVDRKAFNLLKDVDVLHDEDWMDAGGFAPAGLELRDELGRLFSSAARAPESIEVEEQGSERIVLRVRGQYAAGDETTMSYEVRLTFMCGSRRVGIAVSVTNTNLDHEFTDIESLTCAFVPAAPIESGQALVDAKDLYPLRRGPGETEEITFDTATRMRLFQEDELTLSGAPGHEGARLTGAIEVETAGGPIHAAVRDGWQRWPKAFSVDEKQLVFELLPKQPSRNYGQNLPYYQAFPFCEGRYRLKWGVSFTEELMLDFGSMTSVAEADAEANLPVIAVVPRDWYFQTKVLPGMTAGDDSRFEMWDTLISYYFDKHMEFKLNHRPYGFLNYGDWFGERRINWGNNEYDTAHGLSVAFARTGERDLFRWALRAARHQADVDIIHAYPNPLFIGGQNVHVPTHAAIGPYDWYQQAANGHTWCRGMLDTFCLAGDARVQQAALKQGEHMVWQVVPKLINAIVHNPRDAGYPLLGLCALYDLTHDPHYLRAADKIATITMSQDWPMFEEIQYQPALLSFGMQYYYRLTGKTDVKDWIVKYAQQAADRWDEEGVGWPATWRGANPYLNLIWSPQVACAAVLSENDRMHYIAGRSIEAVVVSGIPGYGKQLSTMTMFAPDMMNYLCRYEDEHPDARRTRLEKQDIPFLRTLRETWQSDPLPPLREPEEAR